MMNFIKVKLAIYKLSKGGKPSIKRTNASWMGHSVSNTKNFVKVCDGHNVLYFGNPFHNLYRIVAIPGTNDYVTHSVGGKGRKAA